MLKKNRNKIIPFITPFLMSLIMSVINTLIYQGMTLENLIIAITKKWPVMLIFAIIIAQVIIVPIVKFVVAFINIEHLSLKSINLLESVLIVLGMSGCMTLVELIINKVPMQQLMYVWLRRWPINFVIAFIVQMFVVGKIIKKINLFHNA